MFLSFGHTYRYIYLSTYLHINLFIYIYLTTYICIYISVAMSVSICLYMYIPAGKKDHINFKNPQKPKKEPKLKTICENRINKSLDFLRQRKNYNEKTINRWHWRTQIIYSFGNILPTSNVFKFVYCNYMCSILPQPKVISVSQIQQLQSVAGLDVLSIWHLSADSVFQSP